MITKNLYAILFKNGVLKVGVSENPERRLKTHMTEAIRHGIDYSVFFVSEPTHKYLAAESKLINYCAKTHERNGNEYFTGADFDLARSAMLSLGLLVTWGSEFKKSHFKGMSEISTNLLSPMRELPMNDNKLYLMLKQVINISKDRTVSKGVFVDRLRKKKLLDRKAIFFMDQLDENPDFKVIHSTHPKNGRKIIKYKLA